MRTWHSRAPRQSRGTAAGALPACSDDAPAVLIRQHAISLGLRAVGQTPAGEPTWHQLHVCGTKEIMQHYLIRLLVISLVPHRRASRALASAGEPGGWRIAIIAAPAAAARANTRPARPARGDQGRHVGGQSTFAAWTVGHAPAPPLQPVATLRLRLLLLRLLPEARNCGTKEMIKPV